MFKLVKISMLVLPLLVPIQVFANPAMVPIISYLFSDTEAPPAFTSADTTVVLVGQKIAIILKTSNIGCSAYSISGTDASSFDVGRFTGAVTLKDGVDFVAGESYYFTATAINFEGNTATQNVEIVVSNEDTFRSYKTDAYWMAKNLGATNICTAPRGDFDTDVAYVRSQKDCFGDYYQWGRESDGHEKENSSITTTLATTTTPNHGDFIDNPVDGGSDWTTADSDGSLREASWDVCPTGFKIPSYVDIENEMGVSPSQTIRTIDDAYNFLKLPAAGARNADTDVVGQGAVGRMWASGANEGHPHSLYVSEENDGGRILALSPVYGFNVRCIKEPTDADSYEVSDVVHTQVPVFTSAQSRVISATQHIAITLETTNIGCVAYSISGTDVNSFEVDKFTGVVTLKDGVDFVKGRTYNFIATATDFDGSEATQDVAIIVSMVDTIESSTGAFWMDRNLGASRVCTAVDDEECYGDYYQWGRNADGHEKKDSSVTSNLASTITPDHGSFIETTEDWANKWEHVDEDGLQREANWNPCPTGFRIPTKEELQAEDDAHIYSVHDAFDRLKLPAAGGRDNYNGGEGLELFYVGEAGYVWSSSVDGPTSFFLQLDDGFKTDVLNGHRSKGFSVRCIME